MRFLQRGSLIFICNLTLVSGAFAADVAALRSRWQDLLVQEPAVFAPQSFRNAELAWNALEAAEQRAAPDRALRATAAEKQIVLLEDAIAKTRAAWPAVLQARAGARGARVPELLPREWQSAENTLMAAARKLESGRADAGARQAEEARRAYDAARVSALQSDVLGAAHATLRRLDALEGRRYVPRSYVRALDAVNRADAALQARGEADAEVRAAAARADAEVKHALFLLERMRAACEQPDAARFENTILEWEEALQGVLRPLGIEASFEESLGAGLRAAAARTADLAAESRRLQSDAARDAARADSLHVMVHALQDSLRARDQEGVAARQAGAGYQRFLGLQSAFTRDEGRVFLDNRDVIVRLQGLRFESGAADLGPAAIALLDRVVEALRTFSGASVVVEAHTDAQGAADANRALSQRRADAVRTYLVDKVPMPGNRVTAVGWGAARPVVAESTDADRAVNRRVEIIISPGD